MPSLAQRASARTRRTSSGRLPLTGLALALLCLCALAPDASAHERKFTHSRDWFLPFEGEHEIELRNFLDTTNGSLRTQFEYEYGVTEHFAIEPGLELKENAKGEYEVEAAGLEFRFNLGSYQPDSWLPAFNVEFEFPFESAEATRGEAKLIAARYGSTGNDFALNLNLGTELESGGETEGELIGGWAHALAADLDATGGRANGLRYGAEFIDNFNEGHLQAGPLLEYRISRSWHLLGSYLLAVDDRGENTDVAAFIVEFEL